MWCFETADRLVFTCGSACITVSSRALIPVAIFRSLSTAERQRSRVYLPVVVAVFSWPRLLQNLQWRKDALRFVPWLFLEASICAVILLMLNLQEQCNKKLESLKFFTL